MKFLTLANGVQIPQLGFGTYKVNDEKAGVETIKAALKVGYRLIDTAQVYHNEEIVGKAIRESGIPRKEIFITDKVRFKNHDAVEKTIEESFKKLGTDYIDLMLIHWPYGNYYEAWKVLERYYKEGKLRAIGVSNFEPGRLVDLINYAEIPPMVNQIEANIYAPRQQEIKWHEKYHVLTQVYAPLGHGTTPEILQEPKLLEIAKRHHKTPAQISIKFLLQLGVIPIPKSSNPNRIKENFDLFDFELSKEEMESLLTISKGHRPIIGRPEDPEIVEKMYSKNE